MLNEVIYASQNGDQDMTLFLVKKFTPLINKYARKLGDGEDSKSEMTVCFLEILKNMKLDNFSSLGDGTIVKYIGTAVYHAYVKALQNVIARNCETTSIDSPTDNYILSFSLTTELTQEGLDLPAGILTEKERDILEKLYLSGRSASDIARQYGTTRQNINQIKQRAIEKLRKEYLKK